MLILNCKLVVLWNNHLILVFKLAFKIAIIYLITKKYFIQGICPDPEKIRMLKYLVS